jgi:hypothetical protein
VNGDTNIGNLNGACAVCHRVLDWMQRSDGSGGHWVHTAQDRSNQDHEPVWAPEDAQTEYRCDFCNLNGPTFILPCSDFRIPGPTKQHSVGEWLACGTCAPMVSNGEWTDLTERAITVSPSLSVGIQLGELKRADVREWVTAMYRELRQHIIGPLGPWQPPT